MKSHIQNAKLKIIPIVIGRLSFCYLGFHIWATHMDRFIAIDAPPSNGKSSQNK